MFFKNSSLKTHNIQFFLHPTPSNRNLLIYTYFSATRKSGIRSENKTNKTSQNTKK